MVQGNIQKSFSYIIWDPSTQLWMKDPQSSAEGKGNINWNTIVTVKDVRGRVISWASAGTCGFRGVQLLQQKTRSISFYFVPIPCVLGNTTSRVLFSNGLCYYKQKARFENPQKFTSTIMSWKWIRKLNSGHFQSGRNYKSYTLVKAPTNVLLHLELAFPISLPSLLYMVGLLDWTTTVPKKCMRQKIVRTLPPTNQKEKKLDS